MIKGETPNVGRFCGYCYTPMGKDAAACPYCDRSPSPRYAPLEKLPPEFIALYRACVSERPSS